MRLATRLFIASGLIILATVVGLVSAADGHLRRGLETETADGLEREARLVAALLVTDSSAWPEEARRLGVTRQAFIKVRLADSLVKSH